MNLHVPSQEGCKTTLLLVMSEKMPECQLNVRGPVLVNDFIRLQCQVNYSGTWIPRFFCSNQHHGGQRQTPIPVTECKKHINFFISAVLLLYFLRRCERLSCCRRTAQHSLSLAYFGHLFLDYVLIDNNKKPSCR